MNRANPRRFFLFFWGGGGQVNPGISCYEPRVAVVLKHCQGCMRVHVCVGFVMGRLSAYFLHIA